MHSADGLPIVDRADVHVLAGPLVVMDHDPIAGHDLKSSHAAGSRAIPGSEWESVDEKELLPIGLVDELPGVTGKQRVLTRPFASDDRRLEDVLDQLVALRRVCDLVAARRECEDQCEREWIPDGSSSAPTLR